MRAQDLLVRQITKATEDFIKMIEKVPADKLDWTPGPGTRSALDQYQEVATILEHTWQIYAEHKFDWDEAKWDAYLLHRATFDTLEKLEAELRRQSQMLCHYAQNVPDEDLSEPVIQPWLPGYQVCDAIHYHVWNLSYHEGQIAAILQQIESAPTE